MTGSATPQVPPGAASVSRDPEPASYSGVSSAGWYDACASASDNSSSLPECQPWREQHVCVASPSRDLSRERPFDTSDASSDIGGCPLITDMLQGCPYRMTSYEQMDMTNVDPIYGL